MKATKLARCLLAVLICTAFFPKPAFTQELLLPRSGDYVYYRDSRSGANRLVGYLQPSENTLFIRTYDLATNEDLTLAYKHSGLNNGFVVSEMKTVEGEYSPEKSQRIYDDAYFIWQQRQGIDKKAFPTPIIKTLVPEREAFKVMSRFEYWIPVFQLRQIRTDPPGQGGFDLIKAGQMKSVNDKAFFEFKGFPSDEQAVQYPIPAKDRIDISHYGTTLLLDRNWQYRALEGKYPSYRLSLQTDRDAIVLIETLDLDRRDITDPYFFLKYYILLGLENIKHETVEISEKDNGVIETKYITYNEQTKMSSKLISMLSPIINQAHTVVTVSTYESLYNTNRTYFQRILDSIRF